MGHKNKLNHGILQFIKWTIPIQKYNNLQQLF